MADIAILFERNLQEIFGEGDDALRQKASEEIMHEDAAFVEPHGIYSWERGDRSRRQHHQGRVRHPPVGGTDFIIVRDGKITTIYLRFDGQPDPTGAPLPGQCLVKRGTLQ